MTGIGFPIEHLTSEIQQYINNISEVYQVDKDMVTLAVYVATAVSCGSRVTTFDGIYVNRLTLWAIILIKLFIIFAILKVFFFPNFLKEHAEEGHEADYVATQLLK